MALFVVVLCVVVLVVAVLVVLRVRHRRGGVIVGAKKPGRGTRL
jgi:hypothetical protein